MTDKKARDGAGGDERDSDAVLSGEAQEASAQGLMNEAESYVANEGVDPADAISNAQKPDLSGEIEGQAQVIPAQIHIGKEPSIIALMQARRDLPEDEHSLLTIWKALEGDQIRWGQIIGDEVVQPTPRPESLYEQVFALVEPPRQYEMLTDIARAFCTSDVVDKASAALVAESGAVLAAFTKSVLVPELNSLTESLIQHVASETSSTLTEAARSLTYRMIETFPKVSEFNFAVLLPQPELSQFDATAEILAHFAETYQPLWDSSAVDLALNARLAETWQDYLELPSLRQQLVGVSTDALSVMANSKVYIEQVAALEYRGADRLERYIAERSRTGVDLNAEVRIEAQFLASQREILARLDRLERYIQPPPPTSLSAIPPIPGQDGTTWDAVFDWYYSVPRRRCLDLKQLARMIGMAYGTVKNQHSLYLSDKESLWQ